MNGSIDSHAKLLARLRGGGWISGQDLCEALACSRTAIWKHIEGLRRQGYRIEARPRLGYRLEAAPEAPLPGELDPLLSTRFLGRRMEWLPSVDSTNRYLAELAEAGAPEGLVVAADTQEAGRGRLDRTWFSPPGLNLYASLLLRPAVPLERVASLSILLGLAVRRAVRRLAPALDPRIKWPNDLWLGGRKLCGILCEMQAEPDRVRHVVAGIGLNVNATAADFPRELQSASVSLETATGRTFPRAAVLAEILNTLEPLYLEWVQEGLSPFLEELDAADLLKGRAVTLLQAGRTRAGIARGIAPDGSLLLDTGRETVSIYSGDVSVKTITGLRE